MPNHNGYCTVGTLYGEELTSDAQPLKGRLIAMKLSASLKRCPDTNPNRTTAGLLPGHYSGTHSGGAKNATIELAVATPSFT